MKKIKVGVVEFALPVPRTGSIDVHSGYGRAELGAAIHRQVQERRKSEEAGYQSEVSVVHTFEREGFIFEIGGRMDGFLPDILKIEEIKSTYSVSELARVLKKNPMEHPYCLQLQTYGYFQWISSGRIPLLSFHLVSTKDFSSQDVAIHFDPEDYRHWLERRLSELVLEAEAAEARARRRVKTSLEMKFPFAQPRPGQLELMEALNAGFQERRPMLIQAPTGLGKTAGVLFPAIREAFSRGQKVVYVTPKNSQHSVAEEAAEKIRESGGKGIRSLTITAKSKICFKNEPVCNPDSCEFAKDHYKKVAEHQVIERLGKKRKLSFRAFRAIAEEAEVCPFEIQLDAAAQADLVICDYNYVFAPRSAFGRLTHFDEGKPNLIIDEAHNLPSRSMDYYSPALSSFVLEKMRESLREIDPRYRAEALELLEGCIEVIRDCWPDKCSGPVKIDPPADLFFAQDAELKAFLSRYLEGIEDLERGDPVLRLSFYWSSFTESLNFVEGGDRSEFFTTFHPHSSGGTVKITCCDASSLLKGAYGKFEQIVGFSATLKPFAYYAELSGLEKSELITAEFSSPFPVENRKLLIIPQVSTKFSERKKNVPRINEIIRRVAEQRQGNYFAFFPSFEFLEQVAAQFEPPEGFAFIRQERNMKQAQVDEVLEHLRGNSMPTIVFGVQGGVFSEGVDYPGQALIGAFVVGPPLPVFDLEREEMKAYYQERFGCGFDYAYTYPAMAKAVQAAGRVIRSETDKGIIVLIDNRFLQKSYVKSMPADWVEERPQELVSAAILSEVRAFWQSCGYEARALSSSCTVLPPG